RHTRSKRDWSSDVCSSDLLRRVLIGERLDDPLELRTGRCRERLDLADRGLGGERQEPADLDCDAVAEKRRFTEAGPQRLELLVRSEERRVGKEGRSEGGGE